MWDEWDLHGLLAYTILGAVLVFWLWFTNPDAQWWVLGVVFLMFWLIWLVGALERWWRARRSRSLS